MKRKSILMQEKTPSNSTFQVVLQVQKQPEVILRSGEHFPGILLVYEDEKLKAAKEVKKDGLNRTVTLRITLMHTVVFAAS